MPLRDLISRAVRTVSGRRHKAADGGNRLLPMREAGQVVYDAMDGTTFPMNHGLPLEARLASMATLLAARVPVYGAPSADAELVLLPRAEFANGTFHDGGNAFRRLADRTDTWVRLSVYENDVRETIRRLCAGS